MTTTAGFGSLSVPALDDTMEMSSPANHNIDDDIDIDFDDYGAGGVQLTDDERMLEDADPTRPTTATDDMMEDDLLQPGERDDIEEEIMGDDASQVQEIQQPEDEELIDYGEDELQDQAVDDTVPPLPEKTPGKIGFMQLGETTPNVVESTPAEIPGVTLQEDVSSEAAQLEDPVTSFEESTTLEAHAEDGTAVETVGDHADEAAVHQVDDTTTANIQAHQFEPEEDSPNFPPPLNTAVSTSTDTPGTPTDTGLHPMNIRYGDLFLPLFKSKRQPEGLLKDDNLANLSLAELITNCRQRLASKIGENISEDQELVLGFEHMGLMLVEVCLRHDYIRSNALTPSQDCRAAFESSLHDVLQVYLQLHENDGSDETPPLSLNLTTQLKFQSSFAILKQAAAGGQGMSAFNLSHLTTDEHDFYTEEHEDAGHLVQQGEHDPENRYEDQDYGPTAHADHVEEYQAGLEEQYTGEADEEGYEDYQQEGQYAEEEFYIQEQDEAAVRLDELEHGHKYSQGLLATAFDDPGVAADEVTVAQDQAADPTASSATVPGDSANNSAGEYDDDLIDWDDDSLTTSLSEYDADAHEDFSTFLTEHEEERVKDELPKDSATDLQEQAGDDGNQGPGLPAENFGSEDFLNDPASQENGYETHQGEQAPDGEEPAGEQEEELNFDQADTQDQQHDGYHPDYQPGEEDDQYHTAYDFLDTEEYEHGPEHDVYDGEEDGLEDTVGTVIHHETAEYQEVDAREDFGEEIGYEEDDTAELQNGGTEAISGSPTGKRSFDELEEFDEDDDREVKKARPS